MVSLIIPHFNRANLLINNIAEMGIHNFSNIELVIIDDNSDLYQFSQLKSFLKTFRCVQLVKNEKNYGPGFCRNLGLKLAKSKYVVFLDSDDKININQLITYEHFLLQEKCNGIVFYKFLKSSESNVIEKYDRFNLENLILFLKGKTAINNIPSACLLLSKSFLLDRKVFFPVKIRKSEDTVWKFRLLSKLPNLLHSDSLDYFFFWNDEVDSLTRNLGFKARFSNHFYTVYAMFFLFPLIIRNKNIGWFTPIPRIFSSIRGLLRVIAQYLKWKLS